MAPCYAPSLRSHLVPLLLILQIGLIVIYALYTEIETDSNRGVIAFSELYPEFQDVNVIVILGFGFSSAFLVRYGFSATGFNLLLVVIATQWAILLQGVESWYYLGKVRIHLKSLVVAEMCATSALISIGSVLGKANIVQLILITLLEVSAFVLNQWLSQTVLTVQPLNNIMLLHVFGALFGLMLTFTLFRNTSDFDKEKYETKTGLFSMLGSVVLWVFWPSFNSVLLNDEIPGKRVAAVCSTYLALAVSAVTAGAVSVLSSPKGKFNLIQLQSCMLAGGVAVGVSMPAVREPWEAMAIGFLAALVSTAGFRYLKSHMAKLGFHDTCSVLCTHGLPGLLGWQAQLILQLRDSADKTMMIHFAVYHISALNFTICVSLIMGSITGVLLNWSFWRLPQDKKCFDDQAFWKFPNLAVE